MLSVRITAAGAVFVACLSFLTAPARACDDRFIKKCEKASAAAAAAEEAAEPGKRSAKRVRAVVSRSAKLPRVTRHSRAPRFAVRNARKLVLASGAEPTTRESPLTRRFRGFISPQPIAQNAFEILRKPHVVALDFEPAAIVPTAEGVATESAMAEPAATQPAVAQPAVAAAPTPPRVTTTPKQDRLAKPAPAAAPAPAMELASAESRPVRLADLSPVKPAAASAAIAQAPAAPVTVSEAPAAPQPSGFPIHGLVLALCGALGAASALRFIVGA